MNFGSIVELKKELKELEESLQQSELLLQHKRRDISAFNSDIAEIERSIDALDASKLALHDKARDSNRRKQIFLNEQATFYAQSPQFSRDAYVSQLMDGEAKYDVVSSEAEQLAERIKELQEKPAEAQKRLTVARLMTMLDDLQASLLQKVNETPAGEETRPHELLKAIQELSRERERELFLLRKREHEMRESIHLKKKRIVELRSESERNIGTLRESCEYELMGITDRIQKERKDLINEIQRLEETNNHLTHVIQDTRLSADASTSDRAVVLPADVAMGASRDIGAESKDLRERIAATNGEMHRLMQKTKELQDKMNEEAEKYNHKMSQTKKEIFLYQDEIMRMEEENKSLKDLCDSLAAQLQD
ncbi:unnamed protein product [Phytomonas sp. EM1]|nr:unnamed protein product [Phytomonas sp. EM1]|eukprot:CCW63186.1 unnamed protein product [Phytomonas sp. isolate EM1]